MTGKGDVCTVIKRKRDIHQLDQRLFHISNILQSLNVENLDNAILRAWQNLQEKHVKAELRELPLSTLATFEKGLSLNRLSRHGYNTLFDLYNLSKDDLSDLPGVGEKTALIIHEAMTTLKMSLRKRVQPRFNPDRLSDEELTLLKSMYIKRTILKQSEDLQASFDTYREELEDPLAIARQKKNIFMALFQSRQEKEAIAEAIQSLNEQLLDQPIELFENEVIELASFSPSNEIIIQDFLTNNAQYYAELENLHGPLTTPAAYGLTEDIIETVHAFPLNTDGLDLTLRGYQTFGAKYALTFKRTLLGDEMGLGKTIQAIALIHHLNQEHGVHALIVCPLSVMTNWKREIQRFCGIPLFTFHGKERDQALQDWLTHGGMMVTTYEHTKYLQELKASELDVIIVDEAHYIKNPDAKRSQHVYHLSEMADYALFMSGTPLENRLAEMSQLIDVLQPEITNQLSENMRLLEPLRFQETIGPVYLRRNRQDVLKELPDLTVIPVWTVFGEEEAKYYREAVLNEAIHNMRRAAWTGGSPNQSPKLNMLMELCEQAKQGGHKVIVFSFYKAVLDTIRRHLNDHAYGPLSGDVPNHKRQAIIDAFTKAEAGSVLISQIEAGGVGLNIQAANIVVLCEPQWKPSREEQAISRSYRMGQAKDVTVYRLLAENSIDTSILELLNEKATLFDHYARESEVGGKSLEVEENQLASEVLKKEKERLGVGRW